jgi:hypothetical protein
LIKAGQGIIPENQIYEDFRAKLYTCKPISERAR